MANPKIKHLVLLVELEEGGIHQLSLKDETSDKLLAVLAQLEGSIKILETPLDGLYIEVSKPTEK